MAGEAEPGPSLCQCMQSVQSFAYQAGTEQRALFKAFVFHADAWDPGFPPPLAFRVIVSYKHLELPSEPGPKPHLWPLPGVAGKWLNGGSADVTTTWEQDGVCTLLCRSLSRGHSQCLKLTGLTEALFFFWVGGGRAS